MMTTFQDDTTTAPTPEEYSLAIENQMIADEIIQLTTRLLEPKHRLDVNCDGEAAVRPSWPPRSNVASAFCTGGAAQQLAVASSAQLLPTEMKSSYGPQGKRAEAIAVRRCGHALG